MVKVSVVIPYYEGNRKFVEYCFNSVIAQTFRNFEVVIVTDNTLPSIPKSEEIPIKILENRGKKGAGGARNTGMDNSVGEYIKTLDSDDAILPTYLEKCVEILDSDTHIGLVYTDYAVIDKDNQFLREVKVPDFDLAKFLETNFIGCLTVMFRRDGFRFNEEMCKSEDYEFWLQVAEKYPFFHISQVLAEYRTHEGQLSRRTTTTDFWQHLEKRREKLR